MVKKSLHVKANTEQFIPCTYKPSKTLLRSFRLSKATLIVYRMSFFSGCAKSAVTTSESMLRESDAAKRCLLPLKPPLLRHSCPKRLLGKRDSETHQEGERLSGDSQREFGDLERDLRLW